MRKSSRGRLGNCSCAGLLRRRVTGTGVKSQSTFQGHWTRTGDKYEVTPEGLFIYCGRTDDMFKVSGIWVSPFEVEQALIEHPGVLEAAVVPWADEKGLEKPKAYVVLKEGQRPYPQQQL